MAASSSQSVENQLLTDLEKCIGSENARRLLNNELQELNLWGQNIGGKGTKSLAEALGKGQCNLQSLNLFNNNIGNEGAMSLAEALGKGLCNLRSLHITSNMIGDEGAMSLAEALGKGQGNLQILNLDNNMIRDEGAMSLAEALGKGQCNLRSLNLRRNCIKDEGAKSLAKALKVMHCKLDTLDFSRNILSEIGQMEMLNALKMNFTLKVLKYDWESHLLKAEAENLMKRNKIISKAEAENLMKLNEIISSGGLVGSKDVVQEFLTFEIDLSSPTNSDDKIDKVLQKEMKNELGEMKNAVRIGHKEIEQIVGASMALTLADLAALLRNINQIFGANNDSMLCSKQCHAFKQFVDCTVQRVVQRVCRLYSAKGLHCAEESKIALHQLFSVLQRGLNLIQQCAQPQKCPPSTLLGSTGEFCDIIDDATEYCKMINNIIMDVLEPGPSTEHKHVLVKGLQDRLESDCLRVQEHLKLCYEEDKIALSRSTYFSALSHSLKTDFKESSIAECDLRSEERLGCGSYGAVYKKIWCQDIPVAVKVFQYSDHFKAEYDLFLKIWSIKSSHMIQMLGHFVNGKGESCLVMELMEMDLKMLIQRKSGGFSLIESLDIMTQVAKGMRDLHQIDIVHRDLKPSNILVNSKSLIVKLADFGVSKQDFKTFDDQLHTIAGTNMYMAPEMEKYGGTYTRKVDIYSFGIICVEILTRKETNRDIKMKLRNGQLPQSISNDLLQMIQACLEVEANNRPSFKEIVEKLWEVKKRILVAKSVQENC